MIWRRVLRRGDRCEVGPKWRQCGGSRSGGAGWGGERVALVRWILGAAAVVGGFALVLHLVGQAARFAQSRSRLVALGADISAVRRLAFPEAALSVIVVGAAGTAVGYTSSWTFVQMSPRAAVPYVVIGLKLAGTLIAAGLAGLEAGTNVGTEFQTSQHMGQ